MIDEHASDDVFAPTASGPAVSTAIVAAAAAMTNVVFNCDAFLLSKQHLCPFLAAVLETQMWVQFLSQQATDVTAAALDRDIDMLYFRAVCKSKKQPVPFLTSSK